ncbi:hypothetical protein HDV00_004322 [Rhizophlyctis rosea]|nr:hypothetical protein HDV00_004322 [Rhizophlyctis rosea]
MSRWTRVISIPSLAARSAAYAAMRQPATALRPVPKAPSIATQAGLSHYLLAPRPSQTTPTFRINPSHPPSSLQTLGLRSRTFSSPSDPSYTYTTRPTSSHEPPSSQPPKRDFKSLTREYGPLALATYLTMSFLTFCACFASITFFGVDQARIQAALDYVKAALGFHVPTPEERQQKEQEETKESAKWLQYLPEWTKDPAVRTVLTNVLLAMAMTKLFMPIKIAITAAIVPSVARKLRSMGFNLGQKGGYRAAASEVKERVEDRAQDIRARVAERIDRNKR